MIILNKEFIKKEITIMIDEDRLNHSLAVARKMVEIGKKYNLSKE